MYRPQKNARDYTDRHVHATKERQKPHWQACTVHNRTLETTLTSMYRPQKNVWEDTDEHVQATIERQRPHWQACTGHERTLDTPVFHSGCSPLPSVCLVFTLSSHIMECLFKTKKKKKKKVLSHDCRIIVLGQNKMRLGSTTQWLVCSFYYSGKNKDEWLITLEEIDMTCLNRLKERIRRRTK